MDQIAIAPAFEVKELNQESNQYNTINTAHVLRRAKIWYSWQQPFIMMAKPTNIAMAKIFIVDDDRELVSMLKVWLESEFYLVEVSYDGIEAMQQLGVTHYDVVVLDWELPGMSGYEICKKYRAQQGTAPIIMLTGRKALDDKLSGLGSGADDYLTKPFNVKELGARIRALLRRPQVIVAEQLQAGDIVLDTAKYRVTKAGKEIHLVPKDFALLAFFMRYPDQVFSSDAILQRVWQSDSESTSEAIRTSIKRIRQKLDDDANTEKSIIENIPRVGYRFRSKS